MPGVFESDLESIDVLELAAFAVDPSTQVPTLGYSAVTRAISSEDVDPDRRACIVETLETLPDKESKERFLSLAAIMETARAVINRRDQLGELERNFAFPSMAVDPA